MNCRFDVWLGLALVVCLVAPLRVAGCWKAQPKPAPKTYLCGTFNGEAMPPIDIAEAGLVIHVDRSLSAKIHLCTPAELKAGISRKE